MFLLWASRASSLLSARSPIVDLRLDRSPQSGCALKILFFQSGTNHLFQRSVEPKKPDSMEADQDLETDRSLGVRLSVGGLVMGLDASSAREGFEAAARGFLQNDAGA